MIAVREGYISAEFAVYGHQMCYCDVESIGVRGEAGGTDLQEKHNYFEALRWFHALRHTQTHIRADGVKKASRVRGRDDGPSGKHFWLSRKHLIR